MIVPPLLPNFLEAYEESVVQTGSELYSDYSNEVAGSLPVRYQSLMTALWFDLTGCKYFQHRPLSLTSR